MRLDSSINIPLNANHAIDCDASQIELSGNATPDDGKFDAPVGSIISYVLLRIGNAIGLSWITFGASKDWERNSANEIIKSIDPFISATLRDWATSGRLSSALNETVFAQIRELGSSTLSICAENASALSKMIQAMVVDLSNQEIEVGGKARQGQTVTFLMEILATLYQGGDTAKTTMGIGLCATLGGIFTKEMFSDVLKLSDFSSFVLTSLGVKGMAEAFIRDHIFQNESFNVNHSDNIESLNNFQHTLLRATVKDLQATKFDMSNVYETFTTGPCEQYATQFLKTKDEFCQQLSFGLANDISSALDAIGVRMTKPQREDFTLSLFTAIATQRDDAYQEVAKKFLKICGAENLSEPALNVLSASILGNIKIITNNPTVQGVGSFIKTTSKTLLAAEEFVSNIAELSVGFKADRPINDAIVEAAEKVAKGDLSTIALCKSLLKALPLELGQDAIDSVSKSITERNETAGRVFDATVSATATAVKFTGNVIGQAAECIGTGINKVKSMMAERAKEQEFQRQITQTPSGNSEVDSLRRMIFNINGSADLLDIHTEVINLTHSKRISKDDAETLLNELSQQIQKNPQFTELNSSITELTQLLGGIIEHANYVISTNAKLQALRTANEELASMHQDITAISNSLKRKCAETVSAQTRHANMEDAFDETSEFVNITDAGKLWSANYFLRQDFVDKLNNGYITMKFDGNAESSKYTPQNMHKAIVHNSSKIDSSSSINIMSNLINTSTLNILLPTTILDQLKDKGISYNTNQARFNVDVDTSKTPEISVKITMNAPLILSDSNNECGELQTSFDATISPDAISKGWIVTENKYTQNSLNISNLSHSITAKPIKHKRIRNQ